MTSRPGTFVGSEGAAAASLVTLPHRFFGDVRRRTDFFRLRDFFASGLHTFSPRLNALHNTGCGRTRGIIVMGDARRKSCGTVIRRRRSLGSASKTPLLVVRGGDADCFSAALFMVLGETAATELG